MFDPNTIKFAFNVADGQCLTDAVDTAAPYRDGEYYVADFDFDPAPGGRTTVTLIHYFASRRREARYDTIITLTGRMMVSGAWHIFVGEEVD